MKNLVCILAPLATVSRPSGDRWKEGGVNLVSQRAQRCDLLVVLQPDSRPYMARILEGIN